MPLNDSQKIKIKTVTGGNDKDDLLKCFFYPTSSTTYDLYKKENGVETILASGITSGGSFSYSLDTFTWNVPDPAQPTNPFWINSQAAGGSWKNNDNGVQRQSNGESGTFQGQVSTSTDPEEDAASATA